MSRSRKPRKPLVPKLAVEPLEPRAMCALSPAHVVIPASGVFSSTLEPDGSVEVYGIAGGTTAAEGTYPPLAVEGQGSATKKWTVSPDGRLSSVEDLDPDVGQSPRGAVAISPDGKWLVGTIPSGVAGEMGPLVAWRAGSREAIAIEMPQDVANNFFQVAVANSGTVTFMAYPTAGGQSSHVWTQDGGLVRLLSLYEMEGDASQAGKETVEKAISADGRTVVGFSGDGNLPARPTLWIDGVAHALPTGDLPYGMALSVSADGRIIGGSIQDGNITRPAVWVDGVLQPLTFPANVSNEGNVQQVVSGVGGDPSAWAALGWDWGSLWIARSDGVVHMLSSYLPDQYGLSLTGDNQLRGLLASNDALYIVTYEATFAFGIPQCYGCNYQPPSPTFEGHLLVLPNDFQLNTNERYDLSGDQAVAPDDVLLVINAINADPSTIQYSIPGVRLFALKLDVNGDGQLTAGDALVVINYLNAHRQTLMMQTAAAEGEAAESLPESDWMGLAADEYFQELGGRRRG